MRHLFILLALVLGSARLPAVNEDLPDQAVLDMLAEDHPRDRAIRAGLAWIRTQQREDGALQGGREHAMAITALGLMAHLAAGITVDDVEHGPWMRRSLQRILAGQSTNGYFGEDDGSRMYGHGIATLCLAEVLGMVGDIELEEEIRVALEQAVRVTGHAAMVEKKDPHQGGWRYQPHEDKSDLSLSGWQLMSLHACQQVGIPVSEQVIRRACAYARRLTGDDGSVGYDAPGQDHPALRGLALLSLAIAGEEDDRLADAICARIEGDPVRWQGPWLYYRCYYDAVGISRARPTVWGRYRPLLEGVLLEHQDEEGWWPSPPGDNEARFGKVYPTSMAVLALAVERHVLPAYQR